MIDSLNEVGLADYGARAGEADYSLDLSLVIPAYNESKRLPNYLNSLHDYFSNENFKNYEIIIVDDGSEDKLEQIINKIKVKWDQIVYIKHLLNQGKGAAVRTGVLASKGKYILFTDADGATPIHFEKSFRELIDAGEDIVVGSRKLGSTNIKCQRSFARKLVSWGFSTLVSLIVDIDVKDTQCGFKMFRNCIAQQLFSISKINGYLFDIEILLLAKHFKYSVVEFPIDWTETQGSKIELFFDSLRLFVELLRINRQVSKTLNSLSAIAPSRNRE